MNWKPDDDEGMPSMGELLKTWKEGMAQLNQPRASMYLEIPAQELLSRALVSCYAVSQSAEVPEPVRACALELIRRIAWHAGDTLPDRPGSHRPGGESLGG